MSVAWAPLVVGGILLLVAVASGPTGLTWKGIRGDFSPPIERARWPLGLFGAALIALGLLMLADVIPDGDDESKPDDPFARCASALRDTAVDDGDDRSANVLGRPIEVHRQPGDLVDAGSAMFVAHGDGSVTRIPLKGTLPSRIAPLPNVTVGMPAPGGQVDVAYGAYHVYVVKREPGSDDATLAKIHRSGGPVLRRRALKGADNVAFASGAVWVTTDGGKLLELDPESLKSRRPARIIRAEDPHGLAVRHPCAYVATTAPDGFAAFDVETARRIGEYPAGGSGEVATGAGALWLTSKSKAPPAILRVDPDAPGEPARAVRVSSKPAADALAVSSRSAWSAGGRSVFRVDASGERAQEIDVGGEPVAVAVAGRGSGDETVWVAQRAAGTVTRLRP